MIQQTRLRGGIREPRLVKIGGERDLTLRLWAGGGENVV